jgi:hypothetical protein
MGKKYREFSVRHDFRSAHSYYACAAGLFYGIMFEHRSLQITVHKFKVTVVDCERGVKQNFKHSLANSHEHVSRKRTKGKKEGKLYIQKKENNRVKNRKTQEEGEKECQE